MGLMDLITSNMNAGEKGDYRSRDYNLRDYRVGNYSSGLGRKGGEGLLGALGMALITRQYGNYDNFMSNGAGSETDTLGLDSYEIGESESAEGFGFFSWLGGLFSRKISIMFNGVPLEGRAKDHQVRGGAVPLFPGAVLDLKPAAMIGRISDDKQEVLPLGGGTKARLILSPVDTKFVRAYSVGDFDIKAPKEKGSNVDGFTLEIKEIVAYQLENGMLVASGMKMEDSGTIKLLKPKLTLADKDNKEGKECAIEEATIDAEGIRMKAPPEAVENKDDEKDSKEKDSKEKDGKEKDGKDDDGKEKDDKKKEEKKENEEKEENGSTLTISKDGKIEIKKGDFGANADLGERTFSFNFGKTFGSDDEEEEDVDSNTELDGEQKKSIKKKIKEYKEGFIKKANTGIEQMTFLKGAAQEFFETGKMPENPYENEEGEKSAELEKGVPICPGLTAVISLAPRWKFGFNLGAEMKKPSKETTKITMKVKGNDVQVVKEPDMTRLLVLTVSLSGELGLTLGAALQAGLGYILVAEGKLTATGEAKGNMGNSKFASGEYTVVMFRPGQSESEDPLKQLKLEAGFDIKGNIGASVGLKSKFFSWDKELWSHTIKEWNIAKINGQLILVRENNKEKWKRQSAEYYVSAFGRMIKGGNDKYGLAFMQEEKLAVDNSIKSGEKATESLKSLHERLSKISTDLAAAGGSNVVVESGPDGAYAKMIEDLKILQDDLEKAILNGNMTLKSMEDALQNYKGSKNVEKNIATVEAKISAHEKRIKEMEEWGEGVDEETKNKEAYQHYKEFFGAKSAGREHKQALDDEAKKNIATKERIIAYEEKRVAALKEKYKKRIDEIREMQGKGKTKKEIVEEYRKKSDGTLLKNYARYAAEKKHINEYEEEQRSKYAKKHEERHKKLEEWLKKDENKAGGKEIDLDEPNKEFSEYYTKELNAKRLFANPELLFQGEDAIKKIIEYERGRTDELTNGSLSRIEKLEEYKTDDPAVTPLKNKEAAKYYKDSGGRLGNKYLMKKTIAKAASKADILDYEKEKADDKNLKKKDRKQREILERALKVWKSEVNYADDEMKEEAKKQAEGVEFTQIERWTAEGLCRQWLSENNKDSETSREMITFDRMSIQEQTHMKEGRGLVVSEMAGLSKASWKEKINQLPKETTRDIKKKLQQEEKDMEAEWDKTSKDASHKPFDRMKKTESQEAIYEKVHKGIKSNEKYESFKKHVGIFWNLCNYNFDTESPVPDEDVFSALYDFSNYRDKCVLKANAFKAKFETEDEWDERVNKMKGQYLDKLSDEEKGDFFSASSMKRKGADTYINIDIAERLLEGFDEVHKVRVKKLLDFMGLKDNDSVEKTKKTDEEVWEFYKKIGGGVGFADYFAKAKKESGYSIEDMQRFERYGIKDSSVSGKKKFMEMTEKMINKAVKIGDGEKGMDSHYERYMMLKEEQEKGTAPDQIIKLYVDKMKGGGGFIDKLEQGDNLMVQLTPRQILKYEETWSGQKGSVHDKFLKAMADDSKNNILSNRAFYDKYRKMAIEESKGKELMDKLGMDVILDFDKYYMEKNDAENVLEAEAIIGYEEERMNEAAKKHEERLKSLKSDDVTDENVLDVYQGMSAGKGFFGEKETKKLVSGEKSELGNSVNFKLIIEHENRRLKFYNEAQEKVLKPIKDMENAQKELQSQMDTAHKDYDDVKGILDKWTKDAKAVFEGPDKFKQFTEEATGEGFQKKAEHSEIDAAVKEQGEKLADIEEAGKEMEEAEKMAAVLEGKKAEEEMEEIAAQLDELEHEELIKMTEEKAS